jgi:DNA-binding transcriptional LysR family regulator
VFLADARAILVRVEAAELMLNEFDSLKRGTLAVQASQTIASYWLPRHLVAFRRAYPRSRSVSRSATRRRLRQRSKTERRKLGFVEGAVENEHFVSTRVARDQLVVVAPEHPWAGRARLKPSDIVEGEWILRQPGSGTRSVFEDALEHLGIPPRALRVQLGLPSNEAVRATGGRSWCDSHLRVGRRAEHRGRPAASSGLSPSGTRVPCLAPPGTLPKSCGGRLAEASGKVAGTRHPSGLRGSLERCGRVALLRLYPFALAALGMCHNSPQVFDEYSEPLHFCHLA